MPQFTPGQSISTPDNNVVVEVDPQQPLAKGQHVFELIVVDDDGIKSDPVQVIVVVADDRKPTAVLRAPSLVQIGQSFRLEGTQSFDPPPGKIVEFVWTMIQ